MSEYSQNISEEDPAETQFNNADSRFSKKNVAMSLLHIIIVSLIAITSIIVILTVVGVALPFSIKYRKKTFSVTSPNQKLFECHKNCEYNLVETIPDQLVVDHRYKDTTHAWLDIINNAKHSVRFIEMYWNLYNDVEKYGENGRMILDAIKKRAKEIKIQVAVLTPSDSFPDEPDLSLLTEWGVEVVKIDWAKAFGGVLHTKIIIGDNDHFYIGSANTDWTSLNQVKELGIEVKCSCLGDDMNRLWSKYYYVGSTLNSTMDNFSGWPEDSFTKLNADTPLKLKMNNEPGHAYISAAPKLMAAPGRTNDIDALVKTIESAKETVYISVMDYLPYSFYGSPHGWWGEIDNAIRDAFIRGVNIKMLISKWDHTPPVQQIALKSLLAFSHDFCNSTMYNHETWCNSSLEIRNYVVPEPHGYEPFPYTRVNHAKYMVTDKKAFITTSNWSKGYYYDTAGSSLVSDHANVIHDLHRVFMRDWTSQYVEPVKTGWKPSTSQVIKDHWMSR